MSQIKEKYPGKPFKISYDDDKMLKRTLLTIETFYLVYLFLNNFICRISQEDFIKMKQLEKKILKTGG